MRKAPGAQWIRNWMDSIVGMEEPKKRNISVVAENRTPAI
jgi:hypothetical protein